MINEKIYNEEIWKAFNERFNPAEEFLGTDKEINRQKPLVSVCVPTYNHEHLIEECLDNILNQETNFIFEILVGEDGSQDKTRSIVKEYARNHPDKIRLFLRDRKTSHFYEENGDVSFHFNHKWLRKSAWGKYIALCDGDDYWIDPKKLEKQVDFLESHPDFSMCFHNAEMVYTYKDQSCEFSDIDEGEYTGVDIYKNWLVPTSSVVFRKRAIKNLRHIFNKDFMFGDLILFLTLAESGRMWYLDEVMSVYRKHEGGILYSVFNESRNIQKFIMHQKSIINTFPQEYKKPGHWNISYFYFLLFKNTIKTDFFKSISSLFQSFYYSYRRAAELLYDFIKTRLKNLL